MSTIRHHIPDALLASYATGTLPYAFSLVVATHISLCDSCRAALSAHETLGGALLDDTRPEALSPALLGCVLGALDTPPAAAPPARMGVFPEPVAVALHDAPPDWRRMGAGIRQCVLHRDDNQSVRLLSIPPGQSVPDHGHSGTELTLVLQGAFADEVGHFGVGDVEVANESLEHTPVATPDETCICLAATDAALRFNALLPRLLQPVFGI